MNMNDTFLMETLAAERHQRLEREAEIARAAASARDGATVRRLSAWRRRLARSLAAATRGARA